MKKYLLILLLILFTNLSFGQTLKIVDFRKSYDYYKPLEHKQLLSKGFFLVTDSISTLRKKFIFNKLNKQEIVELTFSEDGEGGEFLTIRYLLKSKISYTNFITKPTLNKFKYSKINKRYQLPTSSYSGENVSLKGMTEINGEKYFEINYNHYKEKALGPVRTNMRIIKPPTLDTIK